MTKERPILFSGAMVRAILDGRKTQTRRVAKEFAGLDVDRILARFPDQSGCPYGRPGDRLWVRETWRPRIVHSCFDMGCDCETVWVDYPAGGEGKVFHGKDIPDEWLMPQAAIKGRSVPSLHMPRWASRITLEIVSTRVERLNDCSDADAVAEGIERDGDGWKCYAGGESSVAFATTSYASLWDSINGRGAWDANPWVWVVEFKQITPQGSSI